MARKSDPEFTGLIGKELDFFGVDGNHFKLGDVVYEAIEDPSDGYRSYLDSIVVRDVGNLIFFKSPLGRVRIEKERDDASSRCFGGWKLIDIATGHEWLIVGTNYSDDYYPSFTFGYYPMVPKIG